MVVRQNKLHEQVAARLAQEIVSGRFPPGSPIPSEQPLIEVYGVSKTVVRETVQALAALRMVRVQHGKRTVVLPESEWDILNPLVQDAYRAEGLAGSLLEELYDVRMALEPAATRWTAERASAEERKRIADISAAMTADKEAADASGGYAEFLAHDRELHVAIAASAGNRVLRAIVRDIHDLLVTSWRWSVLSPEDVEAAFRQHTAIVEAILAHDADAAEAAMRDHLEWAARTDSAPR